MKKIIPYGQHFISKGDISEVNKVLKSNFLTTGPIVQKFENLFSKYTKAKYAVSCSSGTAAIHLALESIGVKNNDNIIEKSKYIIEYKFGNDQERLINKKVYEYEYYD